MTKEEAIKVLDDMKIKIAIPKSAITQRKRNEALDMAIKALEQTDTLDRIITQIEQVRDKDKLCEYPYNSCINIIKEEIKNENNSNG